MNGRKPIPTETRIRRGEAPRRTPLVTARQTPDMPHGLDERAKTAWRQVVRDLDASGVIDRSDGIVIELLATAIARFREARDVIRREGFLHENSQGRVTHPAVGVMERAEKQILQLVDRLPMSPWGRARLNLLMTSDGGADADLEHRIGPPGRLRVVGGEDE
jgi:P27 family predicted phage terminase small subunit